MPDTTADREITVTRLFDAPRELVFAAFTEQEHVTNWWVPAGTTIHEYDSRPGGAWRYTMPGPEGEQYAFQVTFVEIDRPRRLVYDYGSDGDEEPVRTSVSFSDENGQTRVTLQLQFATAAAREEAAQYGAAAGAQQALRSLAEYLTAL
jgi:uncharacterized protein YndB with AHSA1/START domain